MSRAPQHRRARRALVVASVVLVPGLLVSSVAAAQESDPATSTTTTTAAPGGSTTSTTAPPATIPLEGGDFGVLPPGADDPSAPDGGGSQGPIDPDDPAEVPPELAPVVLPDPTPGLNAALGDLADLGVARARADLAAVEETRRTAVLAVAVAYQERAAALAARRAAEARLMEVRGLIDELAVNAVMFGAFADVEPVVTSPSLEQLRDRELMDVTVDSIFDAQAAAEAALRDAVAAEVAATRRVLEAEDVSRAQQGMYLLLRRAVDEAVRTAEQRRRQLGPPILGPSVLDSPSLVSWYRTYYSADPPVAPIVDIIDAYLRVAAEEGVAGDIAFAQAILETGGFRSGHAQGFNFAGIGAYNHCAPTCGFRFASLDDGVRAHLHLLRAYADPALTSAQLASPPDRRVAPERVAVRGCCALWTQLTGVWATDPNYDRKVLGIYRLMVEIGRNLGRLQT